VIYKTAALDVPAVSRDFPGVTVDLLEEDLGCPVVFANGCSGDINPAVGCDGIREPERKRIAAYKTGEVAEAALKASESASHISVEAPMICRKSRCAIQRVERPSREEQERTMSPRIINNLARWTFPLSNANDYIGYFPTLQAIEEGGMGTRLPMLIIAEDGFHTFQRGLESLVASIQ
jgi:hypothetical protein